MPASPKFTKTVRGSAPHNYRPVASPHGPNWVVLTRGGLVSNSHPITASQPKEHVMLSGDYRTAITRCPLFEMSKACDEITVANRLHTLTINKA